MNKFVNFIKKNWLFSILILLIIVIFTVIVILKVTKKNETFEYHPDYSEVYYEIRNRKANEYRIMEVSDEDMAKSYYKDWVYMILNKPEEAYNMLDSNSKKEFDTYEKFEKWIDKYTTSKTKNGKILKYSYKTEASKNEIMILSEDNIRYRFYEYSVNNYKVEILGQERITSSTKLVTKAK